MEDEKNVFSIANPKELDLKLAINAPPTRNITFHSEDEQIGELNWDDGTMKFIGDADESAKIFFDHVIRLVCTCSCQKCGNEDDS